MTIEKGEPWGAPGPLPPDAPTVRTDRELAALVEAQPQGAAPPIAGLAGGDLHTTVGGPGVRSRLGGPDTMRLPIDVGHVELDGVAHRFVAHVVAHRGWWRGPILIVANAQYVGTWNVAPRAHPGDGLLDAVLVDDMSLRDRLVARRRVVTGSHLPHPAISVRRRADHEWTFERPMRVRLDGVDVGRASHISVRVEPDAAVVVV
ncbi:MAG: hypothetical protein AAFZ07_21750 [Actinomycetota bacterium]